MPYKIEHRSGKRPWKIVRSDTGTVVGSSATKADAEASIRARMSAETEAKKKRGGRR
ncbi:MAG: hypothetical protein KDD47_08550 [Acidobacteria bacterium]|nr:hypothetical protein [Acidobacteriota bacterium]